VGLLTVVVILAINGWARGFFQSIAVLVGLIVGTLVAGMMGMVSLAPVMSASWFHFPQLFYFGRPQFEPAPIITMIIISLVSMIESTGVYFALGDIVDRPIEEADLKKGYRAEGLAIIFGGLFNTLPLHGFFTKCRPRSAFWN
jgi:xanthine permease